MNDTDSRTDSQRARPLGLNHVALPVGDADAALEFYRDLLAVEVRGRTTTGVFLDMGDQFVALMEPEEGEPDDHRHVGLVVDDPTALEARLAGSDAEVLDTRGLDFRDPWGNRVQVVGYPEVQFTKVDHVLRGMGLDPGDLAKTEAALAELAEKGMTPN